MNQSGSIQIGSAQEEDLEEVLGLLCDSFDLPLEGARPVFYADPYLERENKRVLRLNGKIVSTLTIVPRAARLGRAEIRLAGIAGVCTSPPMRGRGYGAQLLQDTVRLLAARGYHLAALFPASVDFYRAAGWEFAGRTATLRLAPSALTVFPERRYVRSARAEDIPAMQALYEQDGAGRDLHLPRDLMRWTFLLDNIKQRIVYSPDGARVEGYLLYEYRAEPAQSDPEGLGAMQSLIRVVELHAGTAAARRGLLGHLADHPAVAVIEFEETPVRLDALGLMRAGEPWRNPLSYALIAAAPSFMARVVGLPGLAQALRANWTGFCGTVALILKDGLLGRFGVVITGAGEGAPQVHDAGEGRAFPDVLDRLEADVTDWSALILGRLSGAEAISAGRLKPSSPRAVEHAEALFPERDCFIASPDRF